MINGLCFSLYSDGYIDQFVPQKIINIFQQVHRDGCAMYDDCEKYTSLL